MNDLSHYGDICAIPMFGLLVYYLYKIKNKTQFEYLLLFFSIIGFIVDVSFTYIFLFQIKF